MAIDDSAVLAVVPARAGSKGIPKKNLARVGGLSLVAHAGRVVAQLNWLDAAVISTDSEEIASEGRKHGLEAPFLRPAELADDTASSADAWHHAWTSAESWYQRRFDISVLLQPTSPTREATDITITVTRMVDQRRSSALTVSRTPAHYAPGKLWTMNEKGLVAPYLGTGVRQSLRQLLPTYYHANGICYAVTRKLLIDERRIIGDDCLGVVIERPVVNIDEPFELEFAEWLLTRERSSGR